MPRKSPLLTSPLRNILLELTAAATPSRFSKVPLGADPLGSVPPSGVGLRFTPRLKPLLAVRDWLETQVQRTGASLEPFLANDAAIVIHWPTFLRRAWAAAGDDATELENQGRRIWWMLRPYVQSEDPVLAGYLGRTTPSELDAVQQHAELLLDSAAGRRICKALVEATTPIRDTTAHRKFMRCLPCLQRIAELERQGLTETASVDACPACDARRELAKYSSVIGLEHATNDGIGLKFVYKLHKLLPRDPLTPAVASAVQDIAWLLSGRSDYDGAWREGSLVCVNWATYAERLRENKLREPDAKDRVLHVAERFNAVNQDATGLAADLQRTVFYASRLNAALGELMSPGMHAKRRALANAPVNAFGPRMHQCVTASYETDNGPVEASVRRHGARWCVRIPLQLVPGVPVPRHVRLQRRDPDLDSGEYWWYQRDLQEYIIALRQAHCAPEAAAAESLLNWFATKAHAFQTQPKLFKAAMFDARAATRLVEAHRGERQRLGRFSSLELETLEEFLHSRGSVDCGRAFRGPLTEAEWDKLRELLPFRSRTLLNNKIAELGFEYAKNWGYVAYLKSGYGISKSSRRRAQWLMKGVPLSREVS